MAPKEKPKGAARLSVGQAKPPPKVAAKPKGAAGAGPPAKGNGALVKAKAPAGQVAVPKGRLSVTAKARTSGRLSGPIDPGAIEKLDSPRASLGGSTDFATALAGTQAQSRSASASSGSSGAEELQELRQERDELQAENIRLQRKASQANAVVTKVNDLMDRFQLRDKQQRKELEAAQEQASEHASLQAEHRKSLTGLEQHAAILEEQLIAFRGPNPEDSALSLKIAMPGTEELESELAESRKGNLVAKEAMARAKMQLLHQKEQVEEIAHLNESELAEVIEVKIELEEAIRGRQLYEEEASSERKICQRLQSEAVSGAIGVSELESQGSRDGGLQPSMWRWARLAFLVHSDSVDRSCSELISAAAAVAAQRQRTFSFGAGTADGVQLATTLSSPTASADSGMALSLQEALAGVQEAKAAMSKALEESEAECAYWASRARQMEERAEQAEAQVKELKEAVLKASALGRASAERTVPAAPSAALEAPTTESTTKATEDKDSVKVTVLKMQLAAMKASKKAPSPNLTSKFKFQRGGPSEAFDLDAKVALQQALDDALFNLTQEENALHAAQATAAQMIKEHDEEAYAEARQENEAMQRLTNVHREEMKAIEDVHRDNMKAIEDGHRDEMQATESKLAEDFAAAEEHHRKELKATESGWTQAAEELLATVKNATGSTQTAMSEYEEACSAWTNRESQQSDLVSELNEAVLTKVREAADLQSEVREVMEELQDNSLEQKVQEMQALVEFHESQRETVESERDLLQEEMFKSMEDSMTKSQEAKTVTHEAQIELQRMEDSCNKVRDHLLAELAMHGADLEKQAEVTAQLEKESKATDGPNFQALKLAEESCAAEHSLAERLQEQYTSAKEKIHAEEEECAEQRGRWERAVAAELATQHAHSAECSLYRLAEEGRVAAKQDLEEYTKERRLLEDLLEEKTEEAERLGDEVDELRGQLKSEIENAERMDSLAELADAEDSSEIRELREELMIHSQAADDEIRELREELNSETQAAERGKSQRHSHTQAARKVSHGMVEVAKGIENAVEGVSGAAKHALEGTAKGIQHLEGAAIGITHSTGAAKGIAHLGAAAKGIPHLEGTVHAVSALMHHDKERTARVIPMHGSEQLQVEEDHPAKSGATTPSDGGKGFQIEEEYERLSTPDVLAKLQSKDFPPHDAEQMPQADAEHELVARADSVVKREGGSSSASAAKPDVHFELAEERSSEGAAHPTEDPDFTFVDSKETVSKDQTPPTTSSGFSFFRGHSKSPKSPAAGTDPGSHPSSPGHSKLGGGILSMANTLMRKGKRAEEGDDDAAKGRFRIYTEAEMLGNVAAESDSPGALAVETSHADTSLSAQSDAGALRRLEMELEEERLEKAAALARLESSERDLHASEQSLEFQSHQARPSSADDVDNIQSDEGSPSATEQRLRMELEEERLARASSAAKLEASEGTPSATEKRLQEELEQERQARADALAQLQSPNATEQRLRKELEEERLARSSSADQNLQASEGAPSATEKRLQEELEQERQARAHALAQLQSGYDSVSAAEKRLQHELEQERLARAAALIELQRSEGSLSDREKTLQEELEKERDARRADAVAKLLHGEDAVSASEETLRVNLEKERLARADALANMQRPSSSSAATSVAKVQRGSESSDAVSVSAVGQRLQAYLEVEPLARADALAKMPRGDPHEQEQVARQGAADGTAERVAALAQELRERDDLLSAASAEASELQSERGLCSELRVQNTALRMSLEKRIEESASLEEVAEADNPGASDTTSAAAAALELRVQRRERSRWAGEVEELQQKLEASTSEARHLASRISPPSAVAQAVRQEFSQEWASEAAMMKTAEDAQLEAVAALSEYAEELQEHEALLQAASVQATQFREEESTRLAAGRRSSGSRSGSIFALRTQVGNLEKMLDESCKEQRRLESMEAAAQDLMTNDPSMAMQQAVTEAFEAQQAAAASAEHFTSESSELRAELLHLVDRADTTDRAVASIVGLKIQVAALVKLIERAETEAIADSAQPAAASHRQGRAAYAIDVDTKPLEDEHYDIIAENFAYAEELQKKTARFRECASELSDLRNSAANLLELRDAEIRQKEEQSAQYASELTEMRNSAKGLADSAAAEVRQKEALSAELSQDLIELRNLARASADSAMQEFRMKELTCTANVQAESELCAWWEAQSMQQEARAENLQKVLQNMASTEIAEVNRLKEQLAAKEGRPQLRKEEVAAATSPVETQEDDTSFQQAAAARMAQPALVAAAAGHIASLAEDAERKAIEARQMLEEAELRNDDELQVQRDLCAHWEAVSLSHKARAKQLQGVEVNQARKVTEQLHGEEARAAKMHTWDHLLAARVSAEEALVAELRGEVSVLSGRLEGAVDEFKEESAEYRDLQEAEEHHATKGLELHGQLHFQGSECLEVHATASEMQTQVGLMQRRLNEQSAEFRKFEDAASHELMQARVEVQHESSRMMQEASELRSESAKCSIVSAQEAAAAAAHASAICDAQLTAHKVHADHNAEHECLRLEHGSEVEAAQEHHEVSKQLRMELEEHQDELLRTDFRVQEYEARAQVHHDIAEVRAVELGDLKRRLSTEEEAWWSSERACAMAHGALERVAEVVEKRNLDASSGKDSIARALDFDSLDVVGEPSQPAGHQQEAVSDIVFRAPALPDNMPSSVVAADVALGQAMCTLQSAADSVMDAHFGLRNSPHKPHEEPVQIGSYVDLGAGPANESHAHGDQPSMSSLGWLLPPSASPDAPPDERLKEAEAVLIKAGGALRASADALRETRSDLEKATLRHNMQAVRCFTLSAEDSLQTQAGPSGLHSVGDSTMERSLNEAEPHSRSRLTAAAQGVFIAGASNKKQATMEEQAADLARRAHAQLRSEHFLLEAEIASERHEASSLQAKVEQLQLSLLSAEHRSAAGSNAVKEEMSALKQEQALQLQEATVRLWELSHHLEDRSSAAKGQVQSAEVTDAARLHSVAATEVHRAEAAEESARERYEELQRLILRDAARADADDAASPAAASVSVEQSPEPQAQEAEEHEPELLHSVQAITLAEVEIEAMQHQEESQALQHECAEMLEEIRQHAPNIDLAHGIMSGALADAVDLPGTPGNELRGGVNISTELENSEAAAEPGADVDQLPQTLSQDTQPGSAEMQQLALQAQHAAAATAMKHRNELTACEEECDLLQKMCEHHRVSEKHMQAAAVASSAEAQELAAYLTVEEVAWRATHETSVARQAEHASMNQHLEDACHTATQRLSWLSEQHDQVMLQLDNDSGNEELTSVKASLSRQRQESAELQDCLRLADMQAESTTAKLVDVNLKQQAFLEECDAREASLIAELAALREDSSMELAKLHVELKQREDSTEETCKELEQKLQEEAEKREAELRQEVHSESRKCSEFMQELETCIQDLADLQGHASELTELHRMRDTNALSSQEGSVDLKEEVQSLIETLSNIEDDKHKEMLQEASMRSSALEAETELQEALVFAAEDRSQLESTLSNQLRSHSEEHSRLEEALVIAKEEIGQFEEALIGRQRRGSDSNEAEIELRQARTEIHALEQVAELHAQHSLKVHRLMCEDAQQRVGGGSSRPVRNSALRQWQARVADQSQVLLERSWTLLHRPDSPSQTDTPTPRSETTASANIANLHALEDAQREYVTGNSADAAT